MVFKPIVTVLLIWGACAHAAENPALWWTQDSAGSQDVRLYFFWTETCPHCQRALPDVHLMAEEMEWLELQSFNLNEDPAHGRRYVELAREAGERAMSVPAFLFCGRMMTGYDNAAGMGAALREGLRSCKRSLDAGNDPLAAAPPEDGSALLPAFGEVDLSTWSLPAVAVTLGLLDSFNPCAFFVLLFLLSLLVNARSRARMLLVGGVFVTVSGVVYFMFMAAWLNLFLLVGQLAWVTTGAGLLALVLGLLNVKDFFAPGDGPSLSMPASARPGLFKRMRTLVGAQSLAAMLAGTLVLAVFANAYELLCTAGFPMVFTRILTLQPLSAPGYYGYLALYCLVYVIPLLVIVGVFAWTLGRRKLKEEEGRLLKLMSGLMMVSLGALLIFHPELLNRLGITVLLLAAVCGVSFLLYRRFARSA